MADLTKSSDAGVVNPEYLHPQTRQAGEEIAVGDAVRIDSNGRFVKASSATWLVTGTTGQVAFDGLAPRAIPSGTFGEVYGDGAEFFYADSGLTIGTAIWVSNTAGKLADARVAAAGTDQPVGIVRTATNVQLVRGV